MPSENSNNGTDPHVNGVSSADSYEAALKTSAELGRWLSGLISFIRPDNRMVTAGDSAGSENANRLRLMSYALKICTRLSWRLASKLGTRAGDEVPKRIGFPEMPSRCDVVELAEFLREAVIHSEMQLRSGANGTSVWTIWQRSVRTRLAGLPAVDLVRATAESQGKMELPEPILGLLEKSGFPEKWEADLKTVLPRIAVVLSYLDMIGKMLSADAPLKSSLFLFARVDDLVRELMEFINNRLQHFPDDEDPLFGSLDAAAYTASIELRKVQSQDLIELTEIRPTPLVYARVETAHALLRDSLEMTLVNFAQIIEPGVKPEGIFPELAEKRKRSVELRQNMWDLLQSVQKAEQDVDKFPLDDLRNELREFRGGHTGFLYYKDTEAVERFTEEVIKTSDKKDLVPLLHRFGAYLETLLGQVNMRVVLADEPFAPLEKEPHEMFV